jgi:hypothetical protein
LRKPIEDSHAEVGTFQSMLHLRSCFTCSRIEDRYPRGREFNIIMYKSYSRSPRKNESEWHSNFGSFLISFLMSLIISEQQTNHWRFINTFQGTIVFLPHLLPWIQELVPRNACLVARKSSFWYNPICLFLLFLPLLLESYLKTLSTPVTWSYFPYVFM